MRPHSFIPKLTVLSLALGAGARVQAAPTVAEEFPLQPVLAGLTRVAVATSERGLAAFVWTTFEDEPSAGWAVVLKGEGKPLEVSGVWSAALDEKWERLAVGEEAKVIDATVTPPYSRANKICRELGMDERKLADLLYYDSFAGNGYITRPVIYDVATGARKPLAFVGGDFLDWAGPDKLVVGREAGGAKRPGASALTLVGYDSKKGKVTPLAGPGEVEAKLGDKLSADVRGSPYLAAAWRAVPGLSLAEGKFPDAVVAPRRGGSFGNEMGNVFWRAENGETARLLTGTALAVSADGTWLLAIKNEPTGPYLVAERLAWR